MSASMLVLRLQRFTNDYLDDVSVCRSAIFLLTRMAPSPAFYYQTVPMKLALPLAKGTQRVVYQPAEDRLLPL